MTKGEIAVTSDFCFLTVFHSYMSLVLQITALAGNGLSAK